jgi:Arc/MetJ-type ribon-helix-helix transcriptional regulator
MMKEFLVRFPDELHAEIERRVQRGEFSDASELILAAVRFYAERHRDSDWEHYVEKEVEFSRRNAGS